jgi:hypothetical protein
VPPPPSELMGVDSPLHHQGLRCCVYPSHARLHCSAVPACAPCLATPAPLPRRALCYWSNWMLLRAFLTWQDTVSER